MNAPLNESGLVEQKIDLVRANADEKPKIFISRCLQQVERNKTTICENIFRNKRPSRSQNDL